MTAEWMPPQETLTEPTASAQRPVRLEIPRPAAKRALTGGFKIVPKINTSTSYPDTARGSRVIPESLLKSRRLPARRFRQPIESRDAGGGVTSKCST